MTPIEALGLSWLIFTAALGHVYIVRGAYRNYKREEELMQRGSIEERRDIGTALKVREEVG